MREIDAVGCHDEGDEHRQQRGDARRKAGQGGLGSRAKIAHVRGERAERDPEEPREPSGIEQVARCVALDLNEVRVGAVGERKTD
jgi:hypothetical protein